MKTSTRRRIRATAETIMESLYGRKAYRESQVGKNMHPITSTEAERDEKHARQIAQLIYDLPPQQSGYMSSALADSQGYRIVKRKACNEHFYSRMRSGRRIIEIFDAGGLTIDILCALLDKYRTVHLVTEQENSRLSTIQNQNLTLCHREHYRLAGITLIPVKKLPSGFWDVYTIKGMTFDHLDDACETMKLTRDQLKYRCWSKAKKWSDWTVEKRK